MYVVIIIHRQLNKSEVPPSGNLQSFANISKATSDQLQNLPGFGQVKVKNIKNAFEKPFRNQGTSSLSILASQGKRAPAAEASSIQISKESQSNRTREPSPPWDIETDMVATGDASPLTGNSFDNDMDQTRVFDIELELS